MITAPTKFSGLLATLLLFVSTAFAQVEGPNGHFYQVVMGSTLSWTQAKQNAEAATFNGVHGHLATITSAEEDQFIESLRQQAAPGGYGAVWIGGSQPGPNTATSTEGWQWVNGEGAIPMNGQEGYANWQQGEPNDYNGPGSENYLSTGHFNQFGWNDEGHNGQIFGYVVEFPSGGTRSTVSVAAIDPVATEAPQHSTQPVDEAIFEFTRTGELALDLPVFYSIHGTAVNGGDYNEIARTITIPAGQTSVRLRISPRPDALTVVENMETVGIRIEPSLILTPSAAYRIDEENREASAVIFEHARPTSPALEIALPKSGFAYKNGEVVKILTVVSSSQPVPSVDFYAAGNKIGSAAVSGTEQGISLYEFAWSPHTPGQVQLSAKATIGGAVITSSTIQITVEQSAAIPVVSIRFVDGPIPMIVPPADYVTGAFEVSRTGPSTANLQVFYSVTGSATADADYERLPGYVVIPAGRSSARINVAVKQDSIFEPTETVIAYLVPVEHSVDPTFPSVYTIDPNSNNATVEIFDTGPATNQIPVVSISSFPSEIEEPSPIAGSTIANIKLTRTGSLNSQLTIGLLYSGTATPNVDFGNAVQTITFPAGWSEVAFNIPALDDELPEGSEHTIISIAEASATIPNSSRYTVHPDRRSTRVTILDEDDGPPVVSIWPVQGTTREPRPNEDTAPAVFLVKRSGLTNQSLTVFLSYSGTATAGADYPTPAGSITFAPGQIQRHVELYANDDAIPENTESVVVSIAPPTTQPIQHYVVDSGHSTVTLSILDNDQVLTTIVSVESPDPIATEQLAGTPNNDPARFRISRPNSSDLSRDLRVFFSLHGTAQNGVDYQALPTSAVIPAGQTFVELQVVPIPDGGSNNPTAHHYEFVNSGGISWEQARVLAEQSSHAGVQGHLATITSAEEDAFIDSLRNEAGGGVFWAGGYQEPGETSITEGWKWVNNEGIIPGVNNSPYGYANWLASEPNDYWGPGSENHMVIGWLNSFGWNDQHASGVGGYVVEYDLGTNSTGVLEPMETVALRLEPSPLASPLSDYLIDSTNRTAAAVIFDRTPPSSGAVAVAYPSAGETLDGSGSEIEFVAVTYHPTSDFQNIDFYVGDRYVGGSQPDETSIGGVEVHKLKWTDFAPGNHVLLVVASLPNHQEFRSAPTPFQIQRTTGNRPPHVAIVAPSDGTVLLEGQSLPFRAEASDPDGTIANLALFVDGTLVFATNAPTLQFTLQNLSVGPHSLQARAIDNLGAGGSSPVVNILVRHRDEVSFVERQLPSSYSPGVSFVVQLRAVPRDGTHAYAVEDQPPQGWVVSGISHDGFFDTMTRKVKFGPFTDAANRILTYRVTPPSNASGRHQFIGRSSANGAAYPITGDEYIELIQQHHPADVNKNFIIALEEVTAYAAAWKAGDSWRTGPNPIPLAYVTSAGRIWRNGEGYRFDASQGPAPACWVPLGGPVAAFSAKASSSAQRLIIGPFQPGAAKSVQISITPASGTSCYALEEKPPRGWTVTSVSHNGLFDARTGTVRWGMFVDSTPRNLSYTVTPPSGITAVGTFSGHLSPDGQLLEVGAATSVIAQASTPIEIIGSVYSSSGVTLQISGPAGQTAVIESTSDFQDWTNISSIFIPNGSVEFTDTSAGDDLSFYRLRVQ